MSRMIKELVLRNDRVSLPGLGVFVCEYVPASFSDRGFVINPPYRRIYFRSKKEDDNLLVSFYSEKNGVDEQSARRFIDDFISDIRQELEARRVVEFPELGKLRSTKENTLFFVAAPDVEIYPDGFGLVPVSLKSNAADPVTESASEPPLQLPAEPVSEPVQEQEVEKVSGNRGKTAIRAVLYLLGAAALLLVIFTVVARLFPDSMIIYDLLYSQSELGLLKWAGLI